jgi:prefoldin alpha subunit
LQAGSKDEEEIRKLSVQLRYMEQTVETLQQRLSMVSVALNDLTYANATLEGIEKEKENAEMLVPIGGGNYVNAVLPKSEKVIVGMGAGVSIEKPLPEAKSIMKERIEDLQKTQVSVQQQLTQVVERINLDRNRMESLLSRLREGQQ